MKIVLRLYAVQCEACRNYEFELGGDIVVYFLPISNSTKSLGHSNLVTRSRFEPCTIRIQAENLIITLV
jgi:hypothetical protein